RAGHRCRPTLSVTFSRSLPPMAALTSPLPFCRTHRPGLRTRLSFRQMECEHSCPEARAYADTHWCSQPCGPPLDGSLDRHSPLLPLSASSRSSVVCLSREPPPLVS